MEFLYIIILCLCCVISAFLMLNARLKAENEELKKVIEGLMEANSDYSKMVSYFENELKKNKENKINVKFPSDVPKPEREHITKNLENTIDEYLKIMNIKRKDKENEKI